MCHQKRKLIYVSRPKPGTDTSVAKCCVKDFILLHKYYALNFSQTFHDTLVNLERKKLTIIVQAII